MSSIDRKTETQIVKDALKKAGISAKVKHGTGTTWGWLKVNLGDPAKRNGLIEGGYRYTEEEQALHKKVQEIVKEVSGRGKQEESKICILTQGVRTL